MGSGREGWEVSYGIRRTRIWLWYFGSRSLLERVGHTWPHVRDADLSGSDNVLVAFRILYYMDSCAFVIRRSCNQKGVW